MKAFRQSRAAGLGFAGGPLGDIFGTGTLALVIDAESAPSPRVRAGHLGAARRLGGQRAARAPGAAHGDIHLRAPGARCLARASPRSARVRHDRRGAQTSGAEIMQAHCSHPFAVARRHRAHRSCRLTPHVMACLCVGVPLGPSPARPPCPPPCLAWKRRGAPRCTRRPWAHRSRMHTSPTLAGRPRALACRIGPLFRVLVR